MSEWGHGVYYEHLREINPLCCPFKCPVYYEVRLYSMELRVEVSLFTNHRRLRITILLKIIKVSFCELKAAMVKNSEYNDDNEWMFKSLQLVYGCTVDILAIHGPRCTLESVCIWQVVQLYVMLKGMLRSPHNKWPCIINVIFNMILFIIKGAKHWKLWAWIIWWQHR